MFHKLGMSIATSLPLGSACISVCHLTGHYFYTIYYASVMRAGAVRRVTSARSSMRRCYFTQVNKQLHRY